MVTSGSVMDVKGTIHPKIKKYIFFLLLVVLFISLDSFGVSCLVLEISAIELDIEIHLKNSTVMPLLCRSVPYIGLLQEITFKFIDPNW